jgi:hypothetical protein
MPRFDSQVQNLQQDIGACEYRYRGFREIRASSAYFHTLNQVNHDEKRNSWTDLG